MTSPPLNFLNCYARSGRSNLELPEASENVLSLDGTWRFALHPCPEKALASRFFQSGFRERAGGQLPKAFGVVDSDHATSNEGVVGDGGGAGGRGRGHREKGVRGADGRWRDTPVPSCWQMQVGSHVYI